MALLRSRVEFAKRVFLDRLTTDAQGLAQSGDIDAGPGEQYEYGGVYNAFNFGVGADCSGANGTVIGIALLGPDGFAVPWARQFTTETFPGPFKGFRRVSQQDLLNNPYPIKVNIGHYGGGPNSHMQCEIDGWLMESNGSHGTCTRGHGAMDMADNYWNDHWVLDGPITEDAGNWRQPMGYPLGLDYAGGRPSGQDLKAAGVRFVCRYLSDGGPALPGKQLLPQEAADLKANGIEIVSNWETTADFMLGGYQAGHTDAQRARDWVVHCGGPADGVIYFSCDFDEAESQQPVVNDYLRACGDVLGGPDKVGLYGAYWVGMRALNAGVCHYLWQTQAWSGGNVDSRVNIVQRNKLGYKYVGGVQCDYNEAHREDYGQWGHVVTPPTPVPPSPEPPPHPDPGRPDYQILTYEQLAGPRQMDGYGAGWPQLGNRSVVDALAVIGKALNLPGFAPPEDTPPTEEPQPSTAANSPRTATAGIDAAPPTNAPSTMAFFTKPSK